MTDIFFPKPVEICHFSMIRRRNIFVIFGSGELRVDGYVQWGFSIEAAAIGDGNCRQVRDQLNTCAISYQLKGGGPFSIKGTAEVRRGFPLVLVILIFRHTRISLPVKGFLEPIKACLQLALSHILVVQRGWTHTHTHTHTHIYIYIYIYIYI